MDTERKRGSQQKDREMEKEGHREKERGANKKIERWSHIEKDGHREKERGSQQNRKIERWRMMDTE